MHKLAGKPFALIGVNVVGHPPKKLKEVVDKEKLNWRSIGTDAAIKAHWNDPATPVYYVIDRKGVIRHKWVGYPGAQAMDTALENLLKETNVSE